MIKKLISLAFVSACTYALAAPFQSGNIVLFRVGNGSTPLDTSATANFLDEYTLSGQLVQTFAIPTVVNGNNRILTTSGTALSEGFINLSTNGKLLTICGYDAAPGTPLISTSDSSIYNRVIGIVDAQGNIDTTTAFNAYSGSNFRSAVTVDGSQFWTGGDGLVVLGVATGGTRTVPFGPGQTSVMLAADPRNTRVCKIVNGQLLTSAFNQTWKGINTVGTGLPTAPGNVTTLLPGFNPDPLSTENAYDFAFADPNTLYIANSELVGLGGGVQKWTFNGSIWQLQYTIAAGMNTLEGPRGLLVVPSESGNVIMTTTSDTSGNAVLRAVDNGVGATFTTLVTAAPNTRFRGISFTPQNPTQTVIPSSISVNLGKVQSGDVTSLAANDDVPIVVCKFFIPNQTSPFVQFTVDGTTSFGSVTGLDFKVRSKMVQGGVFQQTLELFNFQTSAYEEARVDALTTVFSVRDLIATGNISRYVGANGLLRARIKVRQTGPSSALTPCSSFDLANWIISG